MACRRTHAHSHTHSTTQKRQKWIERWTRYYARRKRQTNAPMNNRFERGSVCVIPFSVCERDVHWNCISGLMQLIVFSFILLLLLFFLPFILHRKKKTNTNVFFSILRLRGRWWWILCIFVSLVQYNQLVAFTTIVFHILTVSVAPATKNALRR